MSDYTNENFPKETTPPQAANTPDPGVLTEKMVFYLQGAAPWLRFVSIAGFVSLGISVISVLIMAGSDSLDELGLGSGSSALVLITLLPFLVIGFFCLFFTLQFGNKIKMYLQTKNQADLEDAFKNNKSLWTLSGVVLIISLAFAALAIIIAIVMAASTAAALL
jgi:uncharacterized membrane protein YidH (DUF202 family)